MPKWWEKTVEYSYLASKIEQGLSIVLPFAGPLERAIGDTLLIEAETFQIVEFKHSFSSECLASENKKFGDGKAHFETYFEHLQESLETFGYRSRNLPHRFVFGEEVQGTFKVGCAEYWPDEAFTSGPAEPDNFLIYAKALAMIRRPSSNGAVSGGLVVGVDTRNKKMVLIELDQLLQALRTGMDLRFTEAPEGYKM